MATMFSNCYALTELDLSSWVTSKVTILQGMFTYCIELTNLKLNGWDISGVRVLSSLFSDCYKLETLNINGWDFSNVMSFSSTFARCNSLSNVIGTICGIKSSIDLTAAPLTNDSAMVFINGLATVSASRTITFKKSTYDTLTDGQKSIATSKGWTIASK